MDVYNVLPVRFFNCFSFQDPDASIDINGHDKDPIPRYDDTDENKYVIANSTLC